VTDIERQGGERQDDLRVEDLARTADVSVDTIRFYQKRRLLPPPVRDGRIAWYGGEHVARLARIRDLQARGFSLAVIRRLLDGELDAADEPLAAAVVGDDELLSLAELAARAEVPENVLDAVVQAGLLVPQQRDGVDGYRASDVDVLRAGLRLLAAGFPLPDLLALGRRHHEMTRAVAEDAIAMFDEHVRAPLRDANISDTERAERLVDAFRTLLPTATTLVAQHFRSVLLEVAQEHLESVGETAELSAASADPNSTSS
jgi:DNA-binding transcriptional MerR regulator